MFSGSSILVLTCAWIMVSGQPFAKREADNFEFPGESDSPESRYRDDSQFYNHHDRYNHHQVNPYDQYYQGNPYHHGHGSLGHTINHQPSNYVPGGLAHIAHGQGHAFGSSAQAYGEAGVDEYGQSLSHAEVSASGQGQAFGQGHAYGNGHGPSSSGASAQASGVGSSAQASSLNFGAGIGPIGLQFSASHAQAEAGRRPGGLLSALIH